MKTIAYWMMAISFCFSITACCGDCSSAYLGQFLIQEDSKEWLTFAAIENPVFVSPGAQQQPFTYIRPLYNSVEQQYNCQANGDCGTCCDTYLAEIATVELKSFDETNIFLINLQKDFLNHTPEEEPEAIGDYFSMTMNNRLTGELFLDDPKFLARVTLNGVNFDKVFAVVADSSSLDPSSRQPAAYYFQKNNGIVGFIFANGETWNLAQ